MSSKITRPSISSIDQHLGSLEEPESYLRKRIRDSSPLNDSEDFPEGDLSDGLSEDEDVPGCPLPSTPEDNELLEAEVFVFSCKIFSRKFIHTFIDNSG